MFVVMTCKTYKTPSFVTPVYIFLVSNVTQELCGVHPAGFQFAPITALPNFTLDDPSSAIYNLYDRSIVKKVK
jgi:hypothetical protein